MRIVTLSGGRKVLPHRPWAIAVLAVLLAIAIAAASALIARSGSSTSANHSSASGRTVDAIGGPGGEINWDQPFTDGVSASSASDASAHLPFKAVEADSVGTPSRIVLHDPQTVPSDKQAVGFIYHTTKWGVFRVLEEPTTESEAELESLAASCDPTAGCEGTWKVVQLPSGSSALLIAGPATVGVLWISNGRKFDVYGPSSTFTVSAAESIGGAFAAAS